MTAAIVIPARYGSTRLPGKPLALIGGRSMLGRVVDIARKAKAHRPDLSIAVATDDSRIADHCRTELEVDCLMTSAACRTGSDRLAEAAGQLGSDIDIILGFQGDAPFTPPEALLKILETFEREPKAEVVTPVLRLRWSELDALREDKKTTPFTGTTAVVDRTGRALWFSKNILPAIRKEESLRAAPFSPVYQHIGLYGYRRAVLERFTALPPGLYEELEGLEQLRLIENGIHVQTVTLDIEMGLAQAGVDSPQDLERAEAYFNRSS